MNRYSYAIREIAEKEKGLEVLVNHFRGRGYLKAATYLENAMGRVFEHLRLWLETGIIAPRTVSILESIMREIGRRIKKIARNWSDRGAEQISRMVLMRRYDKEEWQDLWKRILNLRDRCKIEITGIQRQVYGIT